MFSICLAFLAFSIHVLFLLKIINFIIFCNFLFLFFFKLKCWGERATHMYMFNVQWQILATYPDESWTCHLFLGPTNFYKNNKKCMSGTPGRDSKILSYKDLCSCSIGNDCICTTCKFSLIFHSMLHYKKNNTFSLLCH